MVAPNWHLLSGTTQETELTYFTLYLFLLLLQHWITISVPCMREQQLLLAYAQQAVQDCHQHQSTAHPNLYGKSPKVSSMRAHLYHTNHAPEYILCKLNLVERDLILLCMQSNQSAVALDP